MLNPITWVVWIGAVLVALSSTRNPLYLGLILILISLVSLAVRARAAATPIPISPLRFGLIVITLSALFNGLLVHIGSRVLFYTPRSWPLIGGPITLEAITFGALNGLALTGIFAAFAVLNLALPVRALIRLTPRAFYPAAVIMSIAMTFAPTTLRQFKQIKEAQAVRGHRVRGLRDWLPLMLPLLIGGLERALQLAEAMTARGFASAESGAYQSSTRLAMIAGLAAVASGWLLQLLWGRKMLGGALLLLGLGLVLGTLWWVGRRAPRTSYRPYRWTIFDGIVIYCAAAAAAVFLTPLPGIERASIYYYPYPKLAWPDFNPLIALATLGLLGPAITFLMAGKRHKESEHSAASLRGS